jgi:hypothetical protein
VQARLPLESCVGGRNLAMEAPLDVEVLAEGVGSMP